MPFFAKPPSLDSSALKIFPLQDFNKTTESLAFQAKNNYGLLHPGFLIPLLCPFSSETGEFLLGRNATERKPYQTSFICSRQNITGLKTSVSENGDKFLLKCKCSEINKGRVGLESLSVDSMRRKEAFHVLKHPCYVRLI